MPFFVQVVNTAMKEQVRFEQIHPESMDEAKKILDEVKQEYYGIGCRKVRLLLELYPDEEDDDDIEDDFDADEMEKQQPQYEWHSPEYDGSPDVGFTKRGEE